MTDITPITHSPEKRLATLPRKIAEPLRQLLRFGQITEETLHRVLDAGELAQDPYKLIAFAAGYLHMRSTGVPVHDVIAMAKSQKRRINLAWSPARWKDEHDKLSRAQSLANLAAENVHYDVSAYTRHLPPVFPGYVIRSSRRLGMEGLRQRHCVAAYHNDLKAGNSAILVIFIDKQRWTTQLQLTGDENCPLRIVQIRTRHNELAPAHVRQKIHEALDIALPKPPPAASMTTEAAQHIYMENLRRILPALRRHDVQSICVRFEGSGDSGAIGDVECYPFALSNILSTERIEYLALERFHDDGVWKSRTVPQRSTLNDAIVALTDDFLDENSHIDWYNNDGGFGSLEIDVVAGSVTMDIKTRYTEAHDAFYEELDIQTGEGLA